MTVDLETDPQLEDRLRRTLHAVAAQMPAAGDTPFVVGPELNRRSRRAPLLLGAAAVVVVVAAIGTFVATRAGESPVRLTQTADQPSEEPSAVTTSPPTTVLGAATTVVSPPLDRDSGAVGVWRNLVAESLVFVFDPAPTINDAYQAGATTQTPSFAAIIRFHSQDAVLGIRYQLFAEGEYRADPAWQQEAAESTSSGVEVEEGRLFVTDKPGDGFRRSVLVTADGVIFVNAEYDIDRHQPSALPTMDEITQLARALASGVRHLNPTGTR